MITQPSTQTHHSKREWKVSNLKTEIDKIKSKEAQEGGLTPGQATTLVRRLERGERGSGLMGLASGDACV